MNGDDLITFIDEVIGELTVVAGHSNGALTAAYSRGGSSISLFVFLPLIRSVTAPVIGILLLLL